MLDYSETIWNGIKLSSELITFCFYVGLGLFYVMLVVPVKPHFIVNDAFEAKIAYSVTPAFDMTCLTKSMINLNKSYQSKWGISCTIGFYIIRHSWKSQVSRDNTCATDKNLTFSLMVRIDFSFGSSEEMNINKAFAPYGVRVRWKKRNLDAQK